LFALHLEQKSLEFQMGATHTIFQAIQEVLELSTSLSLRFQPSLVNIFPPEKAIISGVHFKCIRKRDKLTLKLKIKKAPLFSRVFKALMKKAAQSRMKKRFL
jgi:hypothetical protein